MPHYLGLDIGTSSLKVTVIDENKNIVYKQGYDYTYEEKQEGYREIDPEIWWKHATCAINNVVSIYTDIEVIGITGQMHTTVFLNEKGESVRPAILWNDTRSAYMIPEIKEFLSKFEDTKYIAQIISTGSPLANLLWMKENEQENFTKIHHVVSAYSYLIFKLTGEYSCDYCEASTSSMFDIVNKTWSSRVLDTFSLSKAYFSEVHNSCDIVGKVKDEYLKKFHIKRDIKVIAGTGDNPATAIAMGILNNREPVISLGTSGVVIIPKNDGEFVGKGKNVLCSMHHQNIVNIVQGSVQSAGGTHKWWVKHIAKEHDMNMDQDDIKLSDLGNNNVLFYPHISGDKTIYHDPTLRGAFIGLSTLTCRKDLTQAVFEGVGFSLKELLENLEIKQWPKSIEINGGGSNSDIWMQILANILDTVIEVVGSDATPGYGACLLALMADTNNYDMAEIISKKSFMPSESIANNYKNQYKKYKKIYKLMKQIDQ